MLASRRLILKAAAVAGLAPSAASASVAADLGILRPFYRGTQLQGHLLGMGLMTIPGYLFGNDVDIKYRRNPRLSQEIPFADTFVIVRFLGGYRPDWLRKFGEFDSRFKEASLDYVTRDGSGNLHYRPELILARLQPYFSAGYSADNITLALDNVPWAVAKSGNVSSNLGPWGQKAPPSSMNLWKEIISRFASDLMRVVGPRGSALSFETGVEYDKKVSFSTSQDVFFNYYKATYDGLNAVIPRPKLSPGEFTGIGECFTNSSCVYDSRDLLEELDKDNIPVESMPRSLYGTWSAETGMPSQIVHRAAVSYGRLPGIIPEVHQLGLIGQPFSPGDGFDPAGAQANWQFQTLMGLQAKIKPRRVFHWGGFTSVGKNHFLNGPGFLRLMLDRYLDFRYSILPVMVNNGRIDRSSERMAAVFHSDSRVGILLSNFSVSKSAQSEIISVALPPTLELPDRHQLRMIRYQSASGVFGVIKGHLLDAGHLSPQFSATPLSFGEPLAMASSIDLARSLIEKNSGRYVEVIKKTLRWSPATDLVLNKRQISCRLSSNELVALEFDRR